MTPQKIIFYPRIAQTPFYCELARQLWETYPGTPVLFASFFSQAIDIARSEGFETLYFPEALKQAEARPPDAKWLADFDAFCRSEGMGLNALLGTERFLPSEPEAVRVFRDTHLTVLNDIIAPGTLGISSLYDHFVYLAAGMMAHWKGGAHFAFVGCGVPANRVAGLRLPWQSWENPNSKDDPAVLWERIREEVRKPSEERIAYMTKPVFKDERSPAERRQALRMRTEHARKDFAHGCYFPTHQRRGYGHALAWRWQALCKRLQKPQDFWDITDAHELETLDGPCVFMALHLEPEATILMYSPRLRNQAEACRLVAEALPVGYTLLVKENPKMAGKRDAGFYAGLRCLPNVRLVSTGVSSSALIERSQAVVSLSGTVTLEARLYGKRAYCFGRPPFYRVAHQTGFDLLDELARLDTFFNNDSAAEHIRLQAEWAYWIHSTFVANKAATRYHPKVGALAMDADPGNVYRFHAFITTVLRTQ